MLRTLNQCQEGQVRRSKDEGLTTMFRPLLANTHFSCEQEIKQCLEQYKGNNAYMLIMHRVDFKPSLKQTIRDGCRQEHSREERSL